MLLLNILVLTFGFIQNVHPSSGENTVRGRIIGGTSQNIDQAPHMLQLLRSKYFMCGASLIHIKAALTAAHCTDKATASSLSVRAGSSALKSGGIIVPVQSYYQNKLYNSTTLDGDFSILKFQNAFTITSNIKVIQLINDAVPEDALVQVSGWGVTELGSISTELKKVDLYIISRSNCANSYSWITPNMICAYAQGKDSCQGDSGGGLLYNGKLAGIVSFGYGCANRYPGVYTNVYPYAKFITDTVSLY